MKELTLLVIMAFSLTACTSVRNVTSFKEYNRSMQVVASDLSARGYELSGHKEESASNTVVTAVSYSTQAGFGTAMDNDHFTYDTYTFSNANGDVAEISLKYRGRYSKYSDMNYMETVDLLGCKTSKASDYNNICGSYSTVKSLLSDMNKDANVKIYSENKTLTLTYTLTLILPCVPLLFLL